MEREVGVGVSLSKVLEWDGKVGNWEGVVGWGCQTMFSGGGRLLEWR